MKTNIAIARVLFAGVLGLVIFAGGAAGTRAAKKAAPYVPSPQSVVADMLKLAGVGPGDFVIDLGSGDGRIVLTAGKVFGARGFGVEIEEDLVRHANAAARRQGIADRVRFLKQDLFTTDVSQATVLTMYLLPETVNRLRGKLLAELRPGTRVISHDYALQGWTYERRMQMNLQDKIPISGVTTTLIYLYLVPARISGTWHAILPGALSARAARLEFTQSAMTITGSARVDGHDARLGAATIRGGSIGFRLVLGGKAYAFSANVNGDTIEGTVQGNGIDAPWRASRNSRNLHKD